MEISQSLIEQANRYHQQKNWQMAEKSYRMILATHPHIAQVYNNLGEVLQVQRKHNESIACYQKAIQLAPTQIESYYNLGNALVLAERYDEALEPLRYAIQCWPTLEVAYISLGAAYRGLKQFESEVAVYREAVSKNPQHFAAVFNLGSALKDLGLLTESVETFRRAIQLNPTYLDTYVGLGCVLNFSQRYVEAIEVFHHGLKLQSNHHAMLFNLGIAYFCLGDYHNAIATLKQAYPLNPDVSISSLVQAMQFGCDWDGIEKYAQEVIDLVESDRLVNVSHLIAPFSFIGLVIPTNYQQQLRCAEHWSVQYRSSQSIASQKPYRLASDLSHNPITERRLRIGYISSDFCTHAVAFMIAELFEEHDRSSFEVFGYSIGIDDRSPIRKRIIASFDTFRDLYPFSYAQSTDVIAQDQIDILIDLQGHTRGARTQILANRPAPIQVSYLGFPGTMGADFIDYILVDDFVVPPTEQVYFREKLVPLPGSYQVNDSRLVVSSKATTRSDWGLPQDAFVFCSFNNSYKITPQFYKLWMGLLASNTESILWMAEMNGWAKENLLRCAQQMGVDSSRIVFSPQIPLPEHAERHRLADLTLDTFPYNGHATTSISLRVGVPVVTYAGATMASRVSASLLHALGLDEMIAQSVEDYRAIAHRLAKNRDELSSVRERLLGSTAYQEVYSGKAFARKIENAYRSMWKAYMATSSL
jgi:protein O-GlcNAc transferase